MKKLAVVAGMAAGLLMISSTMFAHHGNARLIPVEGGGMNYSGENPVTLEGTVTLFQYTNPHAKVHFDVTDAQGHITKWVAESAPPARLFRNGWKKDSLKPGDKITAIGLPMSQGLKFLKFIKLVTPDGRELGGNEAGAE